MRPGRAWFRQTVPALLLALLLGAGGAAGLRWSAGAAGAVDCTAIAPQAAPGSAVAWLWSGAVTAASAHVNARLLRASDRVRVAYDTDARFAAPRFSRVTSAHAATGYVAAVALQGLAPDTEYVYALEIDGVLDPVRGRFRTFGFAPFSFQVAVGGDALLGSNMPVFDAITGLVPDLYLNMGDLFYGDIATDDVDCFRAAFDRTLAAPRQASLYRTVPIAYMWDDHDFGPNNSDATSPTRAAARQAYQQIVPHYELAAGPGDVPIYQAFTVGRVRFILTDLRSARTPAILFDGPDKSMLGAEQKAWLKQELAAANDLYPVIVWVSSVPWIASPAFFADHWGGYSTERAELARFIEENRIRGLVMLAADSHMVAVDDGSHNTYGPTQTPLFPVLHAAALNREGSVKGGPYSHGAFANPRAEDGQFALLTVDDQGGDAVCITFSGRRLPAGAAATVNLVNWQRCFAADPVYAVPARLSFQNGVAPHASYTLTQQAVISESAPEMPVQDVARCMVDGDDPPGTGRELVALLRWDLRDIPPGARVKRATVGLHVTDASDGPFTVVAAPRDWSPAELSWRAVRSGDAWHGDGDAVLARWGPMTTGDAGFDLDEAGVGVVQQWLDDATTNHGLLVAGSSTRDGLGFACGAGALPAQRPRLTLELLLDAAHRRYLPLLAAD